MGTASCFLKQQTQRPGLQNWRHSNTAVCVHLLLFNMAVARSLPGTPIDKIQGIEPHFPTINGPAGTTLGSCSPQSSVTPDLGTLCPRVWPHRWVQPTGEFVPLVMTPPDGNPCRACQIFPCGGMLQEKSKNCTHRASGAPDPEDIKNLGLAPGALEVKLIAPIRT